MPVADYPLTSPRRAPCLDSVMTEFGILFFAAIVFGLALGSFCGSAAYRMAHGWSLFTPSGSHCPGCGKRLGVGENIPLVSFFLQRGKCRSCDSNLSILYPIAESAAGCWSGLMFLQFGMTVPYWVFMGIGVILLLISLVDLEAYFIPDVLVVVGAVLAGGASFMGIGAPPTEAFLAAAFGALLLQGVRLGYQALRGREGMGFGDVKLMFLLGLCTGLAGLPFVLMLSALFAFVCTALARRRAVDGSTQLPFGPYLCAGCAAYMLFGDELQRLAVSLGGGA